MSDRLDSSQFECAICLKLLVDPTTTPCGHSFCRGCLRRNVTKMKSKCPLCRAWLKCDPLRLKETRALSELLLAAFPSEYLAREQEYKVETAEFREAKLLPIVGRLPCFCLVPILPKQRLNLHIFEPRYILMIRRCLEGSRKFGMVPQRSPNCGTEVEIVEHQELPGGRFYIEVLGLRVFHVVSTTDTDGYITASVEFPHFDQQEILDEDANVVDVSENSDGDVIIAEDATALEEHDHAQNGSEVADAVFANREAAEMEQTSLQPSRNVGERERNQDLLRRSKSLEALSDKWQRLISMHALEPLSNQSVVHSDLGTIPSACLPAERALWVAALINPVRGIGWPATAPDVRVRMIRAQSTNERLEIVEKALQESIQSLRPTIAKSILRYALILLRTLFRFGFAHAWLVVLGWFARKYYVESFGASSLDLAGPVSNA